MRELLRRAAEMGIRVHAAHLPDGILGYYSPEEGRVYFDFALTPSERVTTIAHELGHAHHGHRCDSDRNERQADTYAAELLIDPSEYAYLERISTDAAYIADELGVTTELVGHFRQHCLQRLGDRTYGIRPHGRFTNALARAIS